MQVIALRLALLAVVLAALGLESGAAPLIWLAAAIALVGLAAFVAALAGVAP